MAYRVDPYDKSIVIDGWENGIADSPYSGISDMRNVNVTSIPGEASVLWKPYNVNVSKVTAGVVSNSSLSADTFTVSGIANIDGICVVFSSLPSCGVANNTKYLVKFTGTNTMQMFATYATYVSNTPVNVSADAATGTFVSVDMAIPTHRYYDKTTGGYYVLDGSGRTWFYNSGFRFIYLLGVDATAISNANGNGLAVYKNFVFVFRNAAIDYMNITTGVWYYNWKPSDGTSGAAYDAMVTTSGVNNPHYAHRGITDDILYYCDANYVGCFYQNASSASFDPATIATFTFQQKALWLPSDDIANCLAELGQNLLVGGQLNAIYPWNRIIQTSGKAIYSGYTYPILLAENFIQRMVTVNTNTYIFAGTRGRIYITNGSQASLYKKVPDHMSGIVEPFFQWGDAVFYKNQLYFGIKCFSNDGNVVNEYGGLWAVDLDSQAIRLVNQLSYATYAGLATVILPIQPINAGNPPFPNSSNPIGIGMFVGWKSDASPATFGIDYNGFYNTPYINSEATIDSDLIPVGTYEKPRDMTRVEYKLTKPLVSGETIVIKYRLLFDKFDSTTGAAQYQTILSGAYDATSGANNYSLSGPINFKNAQWVQFQIVLNSVNSSPSYVRLKEMRIIGLVE